MQCAHTKVISGDESSSKLSIRMGQGSAHQMLQRDTSEIMLRCLLQKNVINYSKLYETCSLSMIEYSICLSYLLCICLVLVQGARRRGCWGREEFPVCLRDRQIHFNSHYLSLQPLLLTPLFPPHHPYLSVSTLPFSLSGSVQMSSRVEAFSSCCL